MLTRDGIEKWVTLGGAVVGAIAGILNLWWKYREKSDRIRVVCGLIDPQITPGEFLHVVNLCDHPIRLADYGYVMRTGKLLSLPQMDANEPTDSERVSYGSSLLESRNSSFETGTTLRDRPIGVYARTTNQSKPRVAFRDETSLWLCCWHRVQLWMKVAYDFT